MTKAVPPNTENKLQPGVVERRNQIDWLSSIDPNIGEHDMGLSVLDQRVMWSITTMIMTSCVDGMPLQRLLACL